MYKLVSSFPYLCSLHMNGNVEATLGFHHYVFKGISIQLSFVLLPSPSLISSLEGLVVLCPPNDQLGSCSNSLFGLFSCKSRGNVHTKLGFHHYVPKRISIQLLFIWLLMPNLISKERVTLFVFKKTNSNQHIYLMVHHQFEVACVERLYTCSHP
jgi:hypothetical protein